jgi:DNA-binding NarL/FixJ family response regulator
MGIQLLIADGQAVARSGFRAFVADTEIEVVAEASLGREVMEIVFARRPDVVLMAVELPDENGFSVLKQIKQKRPRLPVVMVAHQDHPAHFACAQAFGASEFLPRSVDRETLVSAVRAVAAGEQPLNRKRMRRFTGVLPSARSEADLEAPLTVRELDVLRGMTQGITNQKIAEELGISYETVKEHVQHILKKTGLTDRTQVAVWAVRKGVV